MNKYLTGAEARAILNYILDHGPSTTTELRHALRCSFISDQLQALLKGKYLNAGPIKGKRYKKWSLSPHALAYLGETHMDNVSEAYQNLNSIKDNITKFEGGACRTKDADAWRFDLICPTALRQVAAIYAEGNGKYDNDDLPNYCRGLPIADTMKHAINHLQLWMAGDRTENHLAKVIWGLCTIIHFSSNCRHHIHLQEMRELDRQYLEANQDYIANYPKA